MAILGEDGMIRCFWRPDQNLFQNRTRDLIPGALRMMIAMVEQGILPLHEAPWTNQPKPCRQHDAS